jgi:hypothetical protein
MRPPGCAREGLRGVDVAPGRIDHEPVRGGDLRPPALDGAVGRHAIQVRAEVVGREDRTVGRAGDAVGHPEPLHPRLHAAAVRIDEHETRARRPVAGDAAARAVAEPEDQPAAVAHGQAAGRVDAGGDRHRVGVRRVEPQQGAAGLAREVETTVVDDHRLEEAAPGTQHPPARHRPARRHRAGGQPSQHGRRARPTSRAPSPARAARAPRRSSRSARRGSCPRPSGTPPRRGSRCPCPAPPRRP